MDDDSHTCPVCGEKGLKHVDVLWDNLIDEWQLSITETKYINRQQGTSCIRCGNNLRCQAIALAISKEIQSSVLRGECVSNTSEDCKKILEINTAGFLKPYLEKLGSHTLVEYPEYDMQNLAIDSETFDIVVHSDTLEHIPNPLRALSECRRILVDSGMCIFTVPIIVDRFSRNRSGLGKSFHGNSKLQASDYLVHTEFGCDVWKLVVEAGFNTCSFHVLEWPSAIAIVAKK